MCDKDAVWCDNCRKSTSIGHACFILTEDEKAAVSKQKPGPDNFAGYILFDYEAYPDADNKHVVNLVIAEKICVDCIDLSTRCDKCCIVKFHDNDSFCKWLFEQDNCIALAHNLKGYDGCFILQYILKNRTPRDAKHTVLTVGSKMLCIKFRKLKIIDSYSFIPVSLSKLPKMFGITELKKGYFPHTFNQPENQSYVGPYPGI